MAQNIGLQSRLKKFLLVESTEHFVNFSDLRGTNIRRVENDSRSLQVPISKRIPNNYLGRNCKLPQQAFRQKLQNTTKLPRFELLVLKGEISEQMKNSPT